MDDKRRWSTKEDVMRDLTKVNGRKMNRYDRDFFIQGERPPPQLYYDETEEELRLRFYGDKVEGVLDSKIPQDDIIEPDLKAITQMIRMVQDYDTPEDSVNLGVDAAGPRTAQKSPIKIIISKLNPNVSEFIPRQTSNSDSEQNFDAKLTNHKYLKEKRLDTKVDNVKSEDNAQILKEHSVNSNDAARETKQMSAMCNNDAQNATKIIVKSNEVEVSSVEAPSVKPKEVKDIAAKLKDKISVASKLDSFKGKKEKNVAIATLLKLYSTPVVEPDASKPKESKPKLFTPDYFQGHKPIDDSVSNTESGDKSNMDIESNNVAENNCETNLTPDFVEACTTEDNTKETTEGNTKETTEDKLDVLSMPEVQQSIKKVENWFEKPPSKPQSPAIFLSPMAFKRKDPSTCKSPNSDAADKKISKPSTGAAVRYKPTKYADELGKKYMERRKVLDEQKQDIWTKVKIELKAKDEEIKKRASQSNTSNDELESNN